MKEIDKFTREVMEKVSVKERKRLRRLLFVFILLEAVLLIIFLVTTHRTILNLIEKDFFILIRDFDYDVDKIIPQLLVLHGHLWEELIEGVLGPAIVSLALLIILHRKNRSIKFFKRFKEIKKYLK